MPSILAFAWAIVDGEDNLLIAEPPNAAAPAIAVPARNLRRFKYRLLEVISDERISAAFLISIERFPFSLRLSHTNGFPMGPTREDAQWTKKLHSRVDDTPKL